MRFKCEGCLKEYNQDAPLKRHRAKCQALNTLFSQGLTRAREDAEQKILDAKELERTLQGEDAEEIDEDELAREQGYGSEGSEDSGAEPEQEETQPDLGPEDGEEIGDDEDEEREEAGFSAL
ncbi:hypothetical protein A0H81_05063 [Grifola frondosa]|uniref:C2H2-type domain-containing protein n=1 Tax=Grifola frondosa TaxID=5627 RepID=A0A1C7MDJ8_GRIFR|nr:hypothetical protein A0H81_05063 [Grifola frondosa]